MIVDVDANIGSLLAEPLKALGHEVCAIEASESGALAVGGSSKPNLMIIDSQLHDGSGIRARQALDAVPFLVVLALSVEAHLRASRSRPHPRRTWPQGCRGRREPHTIREGT
jgi:DNA-binding response OmpR family regulator